MPVTRSSFPPSIAMLPAREFCLRPLIVALAALGAISFVLATARAQNNPGISQNSNGDGTASLDQHWVGTWAASPQTQEADFGHPAPAPLTFSNQTLRQFVRTSLGGKQVRVRFSNQFGTEPLVINAASIGLPDGNAHMADGSYRALTFSGRQSVTIAPGSLVVSDAALLDVPAMGDLLVSLYLSNPTSGETLHDFSNQTNYVSNGDQTATLAPAIATVTAAYYFVRNVDVLAPVSAGAVVCLGDSITDGAGSSFNSNQRWPNLFAGRLFARSGDAYKMGVLNQGISGNRLCHKNIGPDMLSRFDADVVAQAGVTRVILLAGINDIGLSGYAPDEAVSADDIVAAYRQIIARAHEAGLKIYGGTLTPFCGSNVPYYSDEGETKRNAVNNFIRTSGEFDGVIDFEAAVRDGSNPPRLRPEYDCGDHLHPSDAGYKAMAAAVKMKPFKSLN